MYTLDLTLPRNGSLMRDYAEGKEDAAEFLGCSPYNIETYRERLSALKSRTYPHRERLAEGLRAYNLEIGNDPQALEQIERLRKPDTFAVVAGQQAGLFTGPLYTIHKAIHVIQTARYLEKELGVGVVPVFWIAGEDHDIDEINHIHTIKVEKQFEKIGIKTKKQGKPSASMLTIDPDEMDKAVEHFFSVQAETPHTASLRCLLRETARTSKTLVDWFAKLMVQFFGKHGLVMLESSLPFVRELEKPVFQKVIRQNTQISEILLKAEKRLVEKGYGAQLALEQSSAHFFLYENNERLLIEKTSDGFRTKDRRHAYSTAQLLQLLDKQPDKFSPNVVTRPLMQEHLLPTLAFIGGPGEIAYWAYFKEYFNYMGYSMPVCLPRTSITLIEMAIARKMELFNLPIDTVLNNFPGWKQEWIRLLDEDQFGQSFAEAKQSILDIYQPLARKVTAYDSGLQELVAKNVDKLLEQVAFLEQRTHKSILEKHGVALSRLERIELNLIPRGQWQERVYSVFQFANKYGLDLIDRLVEAPLTFDGSHKVVYL